MRSSRLDTGIWIIIQARMGSSRFPGKVLKDINGKPMLERVIERCLRSGLAQGTCVATTVLEEDVTIAKLCKSLGVPMYFGSTRDVLGRYFLAAKLQEARTIVRVTSDCPLTDTGIIDAAIQFFDLGEYDFVTNRHGRNPYPDGFDVEVMSFSTLKKASGEATDPSDREHVTPYILRHPDLFNIGYMGLDIPIEGKYSVDTPEDLKRIRYIYNLFGEFCGFGEVVSWAQLKDFE